MIEGKKIEKEKRGIERKMDRIIERMRKKHEL